MAGVRLLQNLHTTNNKKCYNIYDTQLMTEQKNNIGIHKVKIKEWSVFM